MANDFKISFSIDLNPYMAGLKTMLNMTQAAGAQIQPLLNLQVKAPEFGVFEKQILSLENEVAQMAASQAQAAAAVAKTGQEGEKAAGSTDGLTDSEKRNRVATDMMSDSFQRAFFAMNTLQMVGSLLKNVFGGLIQSSNDQVQAEASYARALTNRGLLTNTSIDEARTFATEMQSLTGIQDEQTITTMGQLTAMGLQGDQLKRATKLAADLSVVMGTDMRSSARVMADAFNGNTGMLGRYIKGLDEADIKQRGAVSIIEQLTRAVGGQAESFGTTAPGKMAIFNRSVDEIKESMGGFITDILLPIIQPLKDMLDTFLQFPRPLQAIIGGVGLLTTTLIALETIGVRQAIVAMFDMATRTIPMFIAALNGTTVAAAGTAAAVTTLQVAMFGFAAVGLIVAAFIGLTAYLRSAEEQLTRNADAAKKAREELDAFKESLKSFSSQGLQTEIKIVKRSIFETGRESLALQEQLDAISPAKVDPTSKAFDPKSLDRKIALQNEKTALDATNAANKIRLESMTAEETQRNKEEADMQKLLGSKNLLIKAEAELEAAKKKKNAESLTEAEITVINREIQIKEEAVKKLQEMGRVDLEQVQKSTETKRRLEEDLQKFVLDLRTKQEVRQLELAEKSELMAVENNIKRNGQSESYELEKIAITEKYAIKRIEIESKAAIESLEIEKKRLEALNTAEARYQIEIITKRQEELKRKATEDVKIVREESDIKVVGITAAAPETGSIVAQQKLIEDLTRDFNRAQTDEARKAAREQLKIEQDRLDRMLKSNKELSDDQRRSQEEFRREWLESHRVASAAIDGITAGVGTMWNEFVIGNRQAKDGWDAVWLSMRNTALQALGTIIKREIENAILSVTTHTAAEATKTGVTVGGAAARSTALAVETGFSLKSAASDIVGAATAAIRWQIATFGPFAIATIPASLALIYQLFNSVKRTLGFRQGGRLKKGEPGFFEGESDEIIAPEHTFEQIARAELIPRMIIAQEEFNRKRTVETIATTINRSSERTAGGELNAEDVRVFREMRDEIREMKKVLKGKDFEPVFTGLLDSQKLVKRNFSKAQRDVLASRK